MKFFLIKLALSLHIFSQGHSYKAVYVTGCNEEFLDIYADKELTLHVANPVISDGSGKISVFIIKDTKCIRVEER